MAQRQKTKYRGIYRIGRNYYIVYFDGEKYHEKCCGPKLSHALKEKLKRQEALKKGFASILEKQDKVTFKELFSSYENEANRKSYILLFRDDYLNFFGNKKLSQITTEDLFKFRDELKSRPKKRGGEITDSTVNRALAGLRRLFNYGILKGMLEKSPFPQAFKSELFFPEQRGLRKFFTESEMEKILSDSSDWLRPIVLTAYLTGMRESEVLNLRWEWVDLDNGIIYLPFSKTKKDKTGLGQSIIMQNELVDLFKSISRNSEWVFCDERGLPYRKERVYHEFKSLLKRIGINDKRSFKELRHTTASLLFKQGVDPVIIKNQLRHTDLRTTISFYIGQDPSHHREQIEKLSQNLEKIWKNEQLFKNVQPASA